MFLCSVCPNVFPTVQILCDHITLMHPRVGIESYACKQTACFSRFDSLRNLKRHLLAKHANDAEPNVLNADPVQNYVRNEPGPVMNQNDHVNVNVGANPDEPEDHLATFVSAVSEAASVYIGRLNSNTTLNRKNVQEIVSYTSNLFCSGFINMLKRKVEGTLEKSCRGINIDRERNDIMTMFQTLEDPFYGLNNEYQRTQVFQNNGHLILPEEYDIGDVQRYLNVDRMACLVPSSLTGQFISMREVLKSFLQIPGVFGDIMKFVNDLANENSGIIHHFMQGSLWKDISVHRFPGKLVLPIYLYCDDYEPNNSLGSHAGHHELTGVYYTLGCIPPDFQSALANIFVAAIFLSHSRVGENKNGRAFYPIIQELKFLEESGISVVTDAGPMQVYFCLALFLGDNKALNSVLGFTESFSGGHYCRMCREHRNVLMYQLSVNENALRTVENYEVDVNEGNAAVTGVNESCIWNVLNSYHVILNPYCDIMHDIFEGLLRYAMGKILRCLIFERNYFTLETLHDRVDGFDYGPAEFGNKPPVGKLTQDRIVNDNVLVSATEMLCFARYFGEMVGDLVPDQSPVWKYYLLVREILDIVTAPYFQDNCPGYLKTLISEHHEMYINLFNTHLKPKHHFMLHYPQLMYVIGPLVHLSCLVFERKNRESKQMCYVTQSRRNLPLTLAIRHQLKLSSRFLKEGGFISNVKTTGQQPCIVSDLRVFNHISNHIPFEADSLCSTADTISVTGTLYCRHMLVVVQANVNGMPVFGGIEFMILHENVIYFVLRMKKTLLYNNHVCAYEVCNDDNYCFVKRTDLVTHIPLHERVGVNDGKSYVSLRFAL